MNDLHWWSAVDLAAAIRGREVSAVEALEHLVARIERLDGPINAVTQFAGISSETFKSACFAP